MDLQLELERLYQYLRGAYHSTWRSDHDNLALATAAETVKTILEAMDKCAKEPVPDWALQRGFNAAVDTNPSID